MNLQAFSLEGRQAIITGGGRGIGRAIACALAAAGAHVTVVSRTQAQLDQTVAALTAAGGSGQALCADIGDPAAVDQLVQAQDAAGHTPQILVNCAGISPIFKKAEKVGLDEWRQIIDINLHGTFYLTKALGSRMVERGGGSIINITSIGAMRALPRLSAYTASKGALDQLTRTLAVEWAQQGVRVNALAPAYIETEMTAQLQKSDYMRKKIIERTPMGRFGKADEIGWAAVFLASDAASYITGHTLCVDGGWTCW